MLSFFFGVLTKGVEKDIKTKKVESTLVCMVVQIAFIIFILYDNFINSESLSIYSKVLHSKKFYLYAKKRLELAK